ncbi:MAG TPA: Cys-tRNA(Pro) deacylase [Sedimentibacter sp.]|jgi:Cys-tRNA(Pro)/Cys-tRNA(Cys) deacylase|nr:Cys-tRNA(Pro) deacylase [Sedimentibacter sp.]HNZ82740.1 Cys-tRNA(Pro) deacylase [Sedimentibacter sp.]HOH69429.1 Cys-tRNA(Pro) deacylase [Sedimentibacter sp.]HPW99528.1 Cys-tRNA(Pro) deacylase [Sedimentibacter sp.]HQB63008.1 Cys-tRNA(Pro) deacylase [Sedimentibacter sp.]
MAKNTEKQGEQKTNVMRLLDKEKIPYRHHCYADTDAVSGLEVAAVLGQDIDRVFKTLVAVGRSGEHYVFVVPVSRELDLRKAAKTVNEKSVEMIKAKELLPLTGYIHGGCSPIGMKKRFTTVVDESASGKDTIFVSAGKIGYQIEIIPDDLRRIIPFLFADITE